jgi:type III pantothenate kinase
MTVLLPSPPSAWTALAIGNSRLHWAIFLGHDLLETWHTPHSMLENVPQTWAEWQQVSPAFAKATVVYPPLYLASVAPQQTAYWLHYPQVIFLRLENIPLRGVYPTLGIDRVLTLWGAGMIYGWPTLVIDAGTALTLTGADATGTLVGGAILPGLGLQLQSLSQATAGLPTISLPSHLPEYWAKDTDTAIQSGVIYAVLAGLGEAVTRWLTSYPSSAILLTGGDAIMLAAYCQQWQPSPELDHWSTHLKANPDLILHGMATLTQPKDYPHELQSS